jgi:asparagine synthase (glutamine-hydrolysing)
LKGYSLCGIAGFCNLSQTGFVIDEQVLDRMQKRLVHRGPDDQGVWLSHPHQLAFANRRLAIIDLSTAGKQPMSSRPGRTVITFNGEIYNHQIIRKELQARGYVYFSQTDTETLLYAYQEWGIDFLHRLEGQFACALFDADYNELYLIRDRIGEKPLYFSIQNGILSFASEIKALWEAPWNERRLSPQSVYHYLTFMVTPAPLTIFDQIYKLPAGFYLKVNKQREISFHEWYTPLTVLTDAEKKEYQSEAFCIERIKDLLIDSVKKRMVADVPVGAFLSGGIDSSLIVSLMSQFTDKVKTFTIVSADDPAQNEGAWARLVADRYGTDHHELVLTEKDAFKFYERMVYHLDEPLADCVCIPFYYVAQKAREVGIKVAQVGEGADELFFGYSTYAQYKNFYETVWLPSQRFVPAVIKKNVKKIGAFLLNNHLDYQELLMNWADGRSLFWGGALAFNEQQKNKFFKNSSFFVDRLQPDSLVEKMCKGMRQEFDSFAPVDYHVAQLKKNDVMSDFCKQMLYLELKHRIPELLLMRTDKMSMAASVEVRVPFLDHRLVECMLNVPASLKYKHQVTKYLLKKVAQGMIPDIIIQRKKVGFSAPTGKWFSTGRYFSEYFKKMSSDNDAFLHAQINGTQQPFSSTHARGAVQKWVLQNLWVLTNER